MEVFRAAVSCWILRMRFNIAYRVSLSHQQTHRGWWKRDRIGVNLGFSKGIAFGSSCEQEREQLPMFYKAAMSSSPVQQMQLPCARSDSLRDHKSRSSNMSTTTWRKGRLIRGSLLLCICVHPQFHFTHQLLQYNILLPRMHMIEKDATLRDGGNCKLSCSSSMRVCLLPPSHNTRGWLFAKRLWIEIIGNSKN